MGVSQLLKASIGMVTSNFQLGIEDSSPSLVLMFEISDTDLLKIVNAHILMSSSMLSEMSQYKICLNPLKQHIISYIFRHRYAVNSLR